MDGSARVGSHVAQLTWLAPGASRLLPDFLIICPPKTGSTWLAANLSCHPEVFIPQVKEVKYFSVYHKWLDLNWYARHFQDGGTRRRGEASPSYSLLPCQQIQLIRLLIPDVKLIFLMRDPVARAWSHAKHNHRYREANFRAYTGDIETVSDHAWRENFRHPWPLLSGDYLGQLRRWLSVFPREQIFVDLYERIGTDPLGLLSRIFEFVGVSTKVDWSSFRTHEIILPGAAKTISERFKHELRLLLQDRTRELSSFVHEQFGLSVMGDWVGTYGEESGVTCERHYGIDATAGGDEQAQARGPAISAEYRAAERTDHCNVQLDRQATTPDGWHGAILPVDSSPALFAHESDDEYLDTLLQEIDLNNPKIIEKGYHGYSIVFYRGRFLALADGLGDEDKDGMIEVISEPGGNILMADSLEGAKERISRQVIGELRQMQEQSKAQQEELKIQLAQLQILLSSGRDSLVFQQQELGMQLAECQRFVSRVRSSPLFRLRRRLVAFLSKLVGSTPKEG